jgi:hypothetical protein
MMNENRPTISRRSLLQKGLLCAGAMFGVQLATREPERAKLPSAAAGAMTLAFYADTLRGRAHGQLPGKLPVWNGGANRHGDLLDGPGGKKVGEFAANSFGTGGGAGGSNFEMQTVKLTEGTLFGIGAAGNADDEKVHAIVGGTGRFAGAKGSFVVRRSDRKRGGVEFVISLLA